MDVLYYTNYDMQVDALLKGHIDIALHSPIAWVDTQHRSGGTCRAIAMRDSDLDRVAYIIVKKTSSLKRVEDMRDKTLAVDVLDSHQARLISLAFLKDRGLERDKDFTVKRFNPTVGNGKNGDFISGDMNALKAVQRGQADASAMLDLNWDTWTKNGAINPSDYRFLATSEKSDHCVFALRQDFPRDVEQKWLKALFSMSYYNPKHREMIKLEGLTKWLPGRTSSFEPLVDAAKKLGYFEGHKI